MSAVYRLTTTVCFPGEKRPATRTSGWHYDAETFPVGKHQAFEGLPGDLAVVCARHTAFNQIDLDLYKDTDARQFYASELQELTRRWRPFIRRTDEPRSLKYLLYWPDTSWWPAAGKLPGGEMRSGGIVPAPGARHYSGGTYGLFPGGDVVELPDGTRLNTNVVVVTPEIVAAFKRLGLREQSAPQERADVDEILNGWGIEPAGDDDYELVAGPDWGKPGGTDSAAVAVCHRLLSYGDAHPESAGDIFARLVAGYELHEGYAGKGESQVRRALATAAASHVRDDTYQADQDYELWAKFFPPAEMAAIEKRLAATSGAGALTVPSGFWQQLTFLDHVQRAAYARMVSPFAVLLACLARLSGLILPWHYRGELGLGPFPLSTFAAIMGTSSAGKTSAVQVARDVLPMPKHRMIAGVREAPPGSGEGIAHLYLRMKEDHEQVGPKGGRPPKILAQETYNAMVIADEGETLAALSGRSGSTFGAALRTAWSGQVLGSANVTGNRYQVERYALGVTAAFQPSVLRELLAAGDRGTPQRFLFADATDPAIPPAEFAPPWPGPFTLPQFRDSPSFEDFPQFRVISFDASIVRKVRDYRHQVATRATVPAELDGKAYEYTGRIAALLAVVQGWDAVTPDMWDLAGAVWAASCGVRNAYARQAEAIEEKAEESYRGKLAGREAAKAEGVASLAERAHAAAVTACKTYLLSHPDATDGVLWGKAVAAKYRKLCDREVVISDARDA